MEGVTQGIALPSSINPNPFFIRRGFNLNPKPLCPLQGRGLTREIAVPVDFLPFWYRGTRDCLVDIPAVAAPWKGAHQRERTKPS